MTDCPPPGVYPNIPAKDYHAWEAAHFTGLVRYSRTPAHARWEEQNPTSTDKMDLGEAVHVATLQPDLFDERYGVLPDFGNMQSSKNRAARDQFIAENPGKTWIDRATMDKVVVMRNNLLAHPSVQKILERCEDVELSAVWIDEETGATCKARWDIPWFRKGVIWDLKTTRDASEKAFTSSIVNFRYHVQASHYLRGAAANGRTCDAFGIICVENEPPYSVAVYELDEEWLAIGDMEQRKLLAKYVECQRRQEWPAYPTKIMKLRPPQWFVKQNEEAFV